MKTIATVKGHIVIPSSVRRKLGIKEGTHIQLEVDERSKRIILTPITLEYVQRLRGKYKGRGLMKALLAEKRRERKRQVHVSEA